MEGGCGEGLGEAPGAVRRGPCRQRHGHRRIDEFERVRRRREGLYGPRDSAQERDCAPHPLGIAAMYALNQMRLSPS